MDIKTFSSTVRALPADVSVLIRGPHGIGKSHLAQSAADDMEMPLIDRRLSQMSEGDLVGLPELVDGVTRFCPPDWYARACREPVVLLLDEINRATPELQQGAFQIVLARELNGHRLHPDTRVIAAVNASAEYQVNEMDPALLGHHPGHLRFKGQPEPDKVYPSPRSYDRLNHTLSHAGMAPTAVAGDVGSNSGFYALAHGFLGTEAAIAFRDFVDNYELQISPEDVLDEYEKNLDRLKALTNDQANGLAAKIIEHCKENEWTVSQCSNLAKWAKALPGEMMVSLWNGVMETKEVHNITKLHKFLGQAVVEAVQRSRSL